MSELLNGVSNNMHSSSNHLSRNMSATKLLLLKSESDDEPIDPEEEKEEMKSAQEVFLALRFYRKCSYAHLQKTENYIESLPRRQRCMLNKYRQHLSNVRDCIDQNQDVINKMLRENVELCEQNQSEVNGMKRVGHSELEKAQSLLKLIARDWSAACAEEREQSYTPIIDAIEEFFNPDEFERSSIKILVPGAGLGRLTYELACRGFECEGNEFSYFMLIASNFILNRCKQPNSYTLYPWVHQYVNNLRATDQMTSIQFPDVCMSQNQPNGKVVMVAGDFLQVYKKPNSYDSIATCFFIDCANNIIDFIETIFRILVPGGIWVNLGPLLYNYCDIQGENSIEPTYDQLMPIIQTIGFEIVRTETGLRTRYAQNTQSMLKSEYESVFWICRKPYDAVDKANESDDLDVPSNFDGGCDLNNADKFRGNREEVQLNGFNHYYN